MAISLMWCQQSHICLKRTTHVEDWVPRCLVCLLEAFAWLTRADQVDMEQFWISSVIPQSHPA